MRGATTFGGAVLLAAAAAACAANLSPIQTKEAGLLATIKGFVADKQRLDSNAERVITNAKARIDKSGPAAAIVGLNKTGDAGDDAGVSVSVVSDAAQSMLVGGVPAGNLLCYYDDAGLVVGLQQGNVTVCSATSKVGFFCRKGGGGHTRWIGWRPFFAYVGGLLCVRRLTRLLSVSYSTLY